MTVLALPVSACAKSDAGDSARRVSPPALPIAAEPDYSVWNRLLATYYDPARGMNYSALKARDSAALRDLRNALGRVDASRLPPKQQLAYWINLYDVSVVGVVVGHYPVRSILDVSSKIMKWFRDDFEKWGGGDESFLRRYLPQDKAARVSSSSDVAIEYDDYDWTLNDWRR